MENLLLSGFGDKRQKVYAMRILLICCFFLFQDASRAQEPITVPAAQLQKEFSLAGSFSRLYADALGNIYLISSDGSQIYKRSGKGDSLALFNDVKRYGKLYSIDVSNPLNILVYYRDFSTVLILDRFLNNVNKVDLRKAGIIQARAVGLSYDNKIWVYDQQAGRLKKVDMDGNLVFSSDDFRLLFTEAVDLSAIIDNDGQLYLYDTTHGWYLFDYYGAFKKQLPYTGWKDVAVIDHRMIGRQGNILYFATENGFQPASLSLPLPADSLLQSKLLNNKLYILQPSGVDIYSIRF